MKLRISGLIPPLALAACSSARLGGPDAPTLSVPAHFAEGSGEPGAQAGDAGAGEAGDAGAPPPLLTHGSLPDPEPLRLAKQWQYELAYDAGRVAVAAVTPRVFARPVVTARRMGRYAIELWIGSELIERVRFDFPLLAAEDVPEGKRRPLHQPPNFGSGAHVRQQLLVPASPRATRAVLVDRATGSVTPLAWPPDAPLDPVGAEFHDAAR